ncbi:MAG: GNAT family N-acetyltransferase [Sphingomonadales bacterium]|nr:GNAT family N-acetyltransferase [Sphingomonadales bacterium]
MFIRSERLFLRPAWPEDWQDLLEAVADEGVVRNLAMAPWPYTSEDAREFAEMAQDRRHPHFLVTLPGAGGARLIGCVGLAPGEGGVAELGYWIARAHWNRGYATEAARAALSIARTLGHRRMGAAHFLDNPASGRVLARLGFEPVARTERWCRSRGDRVPAQTWTRELETACAGEDVMRAA